MFIALKREIRTNGGYYGGFSDLINQYHLVGSWHRKGETPSTVVGTTGTVSLSHVAIKLDFVPRTINVYYTTGTSYEGFSIYNNDGFRFNEANVKIGRTNSTSTSQTTYNLKANSVVVVDDNTYHIPLHQSTSENITWEAFGYHAN